VTCVRSLVRRLGGVQRSSRRFEDPPLLSHAVVVQALSEAFGDRSREPAAADALAGAALHDDDREFIESCCLAVGTQAVAGSPLLGLAGLCLGHVARRFGFLSEQAVALAEALALRAQADPANVDSRALEGWGDIQSFLRP
jgi:hypothetical protein